MSLEDFWRMEDYSDDLERLAAAGLCGGRRSSAVRSNFVFFLLRTCFLTLTDTSAEISIYRTAPTSLAFSKFAMTFVLNVEPFCDLSPYIHSADIQHA